MIAILAASLLGFVSASVPALSTDEVGKVPLSLREEVQRLSRGNCPENWIEASFVDMGCLYFNSTKALPSWDDTITTCQIATPNSTLVEIMTEQQMAFIQMEIDVLADHEGARHWWTSATDAGINGKWFWAASLAPVEDYVWHTGYPKNEAANNCMMLHSSYRAGYNIGCDYPSAYPICQLR